MFFFSKTLYEYECTTTVFKMESKKDYTLWDGAGCCWKSLRLLCFAAISCGLLKSLNVSAWTYHVGPDFLPWDTAHTWCRTHFTDMVAIQNKEEISYLKENMPFSKNYYWIGIRKVNQVWTWVGTNKSLTKEAENWAPLEPNNKGSQQDCVEMYIKRKKDNGKWNDEPCNNKKTALCYLANCNASSCSQRGMCVETIGNYTCDCRPGFYGRDCERVITCKRIYFVSKEVNINCSHPAGQFAYQSSCSFQCNEGFQLKGASTLQCSENGNWTADIPECEAKPCSMLAVPSYAKMICSHPIAQFSFMSMCKYTCDYGFILNGSSVTECTSSGQWTSIEQTCQVKECLQLEAPNMGYMNCSNPIKNFSFTSSCEFSCESGFLLNGSDILSCSEFGNWTQSAPTCQVKECPPLEAPNMGYMTCSNPIKDFSFNSSCEFSCESGFRLNGSDVLYCSEFGNWTKSAPTCQAIQCEQLSTSHPRQINCSDLYGNYSYGSWCQFHCLEGFVLNGTSIIHCQSSGYWSDEMPNCSVFALSLGRQLLSYLGSSVLATFFLISIGTLIAFTVNRLNQKKKSGLLTSHRMPSNAFDNPVFETT